MIKPIDIRQASYRGILQQLFPNLPGTAVDILLQSIDSDLTTPLRVDATSSPSLVVNVGPAIISNAESNRNRSIPYIGSSIPTFASGTITFPSSDGGLITVSPGSDVNLTCPVGNYVKVLISLDPSGNLVVTLGTPNTSPSTATLPPPVSGDLAAAYIILFNNAGTIQNIQQNAIYQLSLGGGGGGTPQAGFSQEVSISAGATSVNVLFPSTLPGTNYVVIPSFINLVDPSPQFQPIEITNKSTTGFTATWNAPTDSANYILGYIVPSVQEQVGEIALGSGVTSITVTLPITLSGTNYVVVPNLTNLIDTNPQFQPIEITAKTNSTFTASWNSPTDSANYFLSYHLAQYQ